VVLAGDNPGYASVMQPFPDQLVDPTDTKAFAEKLALYLGDGALRARIAKQQRKYVRRFDFEVVGPALLDVYAKALQSRPKS